jgi:hypothetical protein
MNTFRTTFSAQPAKHLIGLTDKIFTIGSCFSEAIGSQFIANKILAVINPFGILYNPHSIHKVIHYITLDQPIPQNTYVQRDDVFLNYDFHSELSSLDLNDLQERLNGTVNAAHSFLKKTSWLIITYGTAWVYERTDTKDIVANCHKMPQILFTKTLLTQKKILESFDIMYRELKSFNPEINIILTVSPVRHLKDTLELNSVSKSVLRVACHTLTQQYRDVDYFPAYEILLDDLRDYRFYKSDMIHPSEVAEEYIWEKFGAKYFNDNLKAFLLRWKEIQSALAHKPFHPASSAHQHFLIETLKKLEELKKVVNVDEEMAVLNSQVNV